jgi:hypothetical protein
MRFIGMQTFGQKKGGKETVRIETIIFNIEVQKKVFT